MADPERNIRLLNHQPQDYTHVEFGVGWVTFSKGWYGILPFNETTYYLKPNSMQRLLNLMLHNGNYELVRGATLQTRESIQYLDHYYKFTYHRK